MGIMENRVIIAGSREFNDYDTAERAIIEAFKSIDSASPVRIVSGHCRGADMLGERFAAKVSKIEEDLSCGLCYTKSLEECRRWCRGLL